VNLVLCSLVHPKATAKKYDDIDYYLRVYNNKKKKKKNTMTSQLTNRSSEL